MSKPENSLSQPIPNTPRRHGDQHPSIKMERPLGAAPIDQDLLLQEIFRHIEAKEEVIKNSTLPPPVCKPPPSRTRLKIVALVGVAMLLGYALLSSPDGVVVRTDGSIAGALNNARAFVQGPGFYKKQQALANAKLQKLLDEPRKKKKFDEEMRALQAEITQDLEKTYREYPALRPTDAERQAEMLRARADQLELAEMDRDLETLRLEEIRQIEQILKILVEKPRHQ